MKNIFLKYLPHKNKNIDWKKSIGYKVHFIYDDIEDDIEIIEYIIGIHPKLKIKYNDNYIDIDTTILKNCNLGKILNKHTDDYKINIGQTIADDKRNIIITNKEYRPKYKSDGTIRQNYKWYKYTCEVCGWTEGWMEESNLLQGKGCSCCSNRTVVEGINDIPTTAPEMVKYFQGGYDEAKLYTKSSNKIIYPICPYCGRVKDKKMMINTINFENSIGCSCSDTISFPEKAIANLLLQLNIDFQTQLTKTTFKWCKDYRYDFYFELDNEKYILEANGRQHYEDNTNFKMNLKETLLNDKIKKELAIKNDIKEENYIVIDCRKSDIEWIRDNEKGIINSKLNELFNLGKIDWIQVVEYALVNLVKVACEYKKNNTELTTGNIGKLMGYSKDTIRKWLKAGTELNWCYYNSEEENFNRYIALKTLNKKNNSKKVNIYKNEILLGVFTSIAELERQSEKLYGIKLNAKNISAVCTGRRKIYKGFIFKFSKEVVA